MMDGATVGMAGQAQGNNASTMPPLVRAIDRVQRLANSLADLGDQLHGQATRTIGNNAVEPASPPMPDGKMAENAPLLHRLEEALTIAQRNLQRASAGANRLAEIG